MDTPGQIWHLIAKTLNGEASRQEQEELSLILREDEALQQQYDVLTRIWSEKENSLETPNNEDARNSISRIINKAVVEAPVAELHSPVKRISSKRLWYSAAAILILVSGSLFWKALSGRSESPKQEALEARKGSRTRSLLPDGTTVWLNAGSKLYYDHNFSEKTREVRLEGEAFFDVVKQVDRPFIVHTSGIDIKVLGTAFNVKSYPEDKNVETTLYRGLVQVFRHEETSSKAIELKPNQKLILAKEAAKETDDLSQEIKSIPTKALPATFIIAPIDSTKKENERFETAWLYSRLEFRGDSFEELSRKLERWYNVTIVFTDEEVKHLNFNGSFEKETITQAFVALKTAVPFDYETKGNEIFVSSKTRR
ncbi:MAG: FecR domain-containing protein [Chitinophagaceae bacterium]|nr:FecR domain-containing protein [Chitinophagaceae bacterium]